MYSLCVGAYRRVGFQRSIGEVIRTSSPGCALRRCLYSGTKPSLFSHKLSSVLAHISDASKSRQLHILGIHQQQVAACSLLHTNQMDGVENATLESGFLSEDHTQGKKVYIIVLNYTLPRGLAKLWHHAEVKVCADGGCNRLYDELPAMLPGEDPTVLRSTYVPDVVKGDLDSLRPEIHEFYSSLGVPVHDLSADQDTTDLTKCVSYIEASSLGDAAPLDRHVILAVGALGGRLDHTLGNLNTLYQFRHLNLVLWGDGNLVRLCRAGRTLIHPHALEGPTCGLIPLGRSATATSTGLKWNLSNTLMQVGGLISTCNVLEEKEVVVESDEDLIWVTAVADQ